MNDFIPSFDALAKVCGVTALSQQHQLLLQQLQKVNPQLNFKHVLTRGGWHRTGGVVNTQGERIAASLREWLEAESNGDVNSLIEQHQNSGFIATRLMGKTHYFTAQTGELAEDFVQLEVEELYEVQDHILFGDECFADDIEDIIHPLEVKKLAPELVTLACYRFRRITSIKEFLASMSTHMMNRGSKYISIQRFMQDWQNTSAKEEGPFCNFWVLSLQEYIDAWGESIKQVKPVSTFYNEIPLIKLSSEQRGSRLANLVRKFDQEIGYPMAWYFFMLSHSEVPHQLAAAIHRDLMGAYDYLPVRDLMVLKNWSENPYGI